MMEIGRKRQGRSVNGDIGEERLATQFLRGWDVEAGQQALGKEVPGLA